MNAVLRNKGAMIWSGSSLIIASLLIGLMSPHLSGLIVIIPVIGYAAWHGYLETIDADEFPRHDVGITSVPRSAEGEN